MKRMLSIILSLALLLALSVPAFADTAKGSTLRLASFSGTVTMTHASGTGVTPKADLRLYNGYTISTGSGSDAYISLDGTKAVKLGANGKVSVKQSGKQLEVSVISGTLYFNVTAPLKGDENLNIRTSTMVTGVRGSFGWVTRTEMGLMHGHVTLVCVNPVTGEARITEVYSGERVYYGPDADVAADPKLKEIDFIKAQITNADVPAIVVEEMRDDLELQAQVTADVPTVDVPELLGLEGAKRDAEEAAEAERQEDIDARLAAQDAAIAADPEDYLFEDTGDSGGGGTPTYYTVTMPAAYSNYSIEYIGSPAAAGSTYSIPSGSSFVFTVIPDSGYSVYRDYLEVTASTDAPATITQDSTNCNVSVPITGDTILNVGSGIYFGVSDETALESALSASQPEIVVNSPITTSANHAIGNDQTVLLESDLTVGDGQTFTISPVGGGTTSGKLIVANGVNLATNITASSTITIQNEGTIENSGTVTINSGGVLNNYSNTTFINESTGNLILNGNLFNGDGSHPGHLVNKGTITSTTMNFENYDTFDNSGIINLRNYLTNQSSGTLNNTGTINIADDTSSGTLANNGTINNGTFDSTTGEVTGTGIIINYASATNASAGSGTINNFSGTINNYPESSITNMSAGTQYASINNNAVINNYGTISNQHSTYDALIRISSGGVFNNGGTVSGVNMRGVVTSAGRIETDGSTVGTLNNVRGSITLNSSGVLYNGQPSSVTNGADGTIIVESGGTIDNYGNFENNNLITNHGSVVNETTGTFTNTSGTIDNYASDSATLTNISGGTINTL